MDKITTPSVNCQINENGEVEQRLGYLDTGWNLNEANKRSGPPYYMKKYDVTFLAINTKVYYIDHNNGDAIVNTGLTLTANTRTRIDEYEGDVYLTNVTDGLFRIVVGRLNGATSAGGNITVDRDMAARLSVFGLTTGTVRIGGTGETYTGVTVSSGALTATSSAAYTDNAIAIRTQDISTSREKGSKVFFWKRRMGIIGSIVADNADQPNNTVFYGQFSTPQALELIIDYTYGTGGSTREQVGNYGSVTNVIPAKDYLYQFTQDEAYITGADDVTLSGTGIGTTTPDLRDRDHGCLNEDSAASMGDDEIAYITSDKRIMRIRISTESGAAVVYPDESFDLPMRNLLKDMNDDQTGALAYHWKGGGKTIFQVRISGQWYWLVYDNRIKAWQPPWQIRTVSGFFERQGVLYGVDYSDDTIFSFFTSFADNGSPIDSKIVTGDFDIRDGMIKEVETAGLISWAAKIRLQAHVTNQRGGRRSGSEKNILGSAFTYSDEDFSVGAIRGGGAGVTAETTMVAAWKKSFDVFPSEANRVQLTVSQSEEGGYFRLSSYAIHYVPYRHFAASA
ncbi:MAG: stabilization protein [Siphoviridae sp. ctpQM7]|nr:MAG: stabilization protein [Siphoviridae sp. ctpQM7]